MDRTDHCPSPRIIIKFNPFIHNNNNIHDEYVEWDEKGEKNRVRSTKKRTRSRGVFCLT
jgi:hypothetical protein